MKKLILLLVLCAVPAFAGSYSAGTVGSPTFGAAKFGNGTTATSDSNYIGLPNIPIQSGTSSWTIEAWIKVSGSAFYEAVSLGNVTANIQLAVSAGQFVTVIAGGTGNFAASVLSSGITVNNGAWHHVAVVMTGGTALTTWVDGVAGATFSGTSVAIGNTGTIGRAAWVTGVSFPGSIDEVAFWATAKYTTGFTPPTAAYLGNEANLAALYHLESSGLDSSTSVGFNGAFIGLPVFGTGKFSSATTTTTDANAISLPNIPFQQSSSSTWTIEAWLKVSGSGTYVALYQGTSTIVLWMGASGGKFDFSIAGGTGNFAASLLSSGITINDGAWHHCALVMTSGTTLTSYVDGVAGATFAGTVAPITGTGKIGSYTPIGSGLAWPGSIDEVAFWATAKYTTGFTPPTAAYVGNEANLIALYHLESNAVDSGTNITGITIAMNNGAILYSPYNWVVNGTNARSVNPGAYFRVFFTGTSVTLLADTTNNAANFPQLWARVDNSSWVQLTVNTGTLTVATGLLNRQHTLEVIFKSADFNLERWAPTAASMVTLTGIQLDPWQTVSAPQRRTKNILIYGDSITEGVMVKGLIPPLNTDQDDWMSDYSYMLTTSVDAEVGVVAFGAQGVTRPTGSTFGNVPNLQNAYNLVFSGQARSFTSPPPDLVIYNHGTNDSPSITAGLTAVISGIIAAAPNSKHLILVPFQQSHIAEIQAVVTGMHSANVTYSGTAGWFNPANSYDGVHPYDYEHIGHISLNLFPVVQRLLYQGTVGVFTSH